MLVVEGGAALESVPSKSVFPVEAVIFLRLRNPSPVAFDCSGSFLRRNLRLIPAIARDPGSLAHEGRSDLTPPAPQTEEKP
jgi:hypothetical protein